MAEASAELTAPTFITLGPEGSDHQQAALEYLGLQGLLETASIDLVSDMAGEGLERVRSEPNSFLVQCSAHHQANVVNMRYPREVFMVDSFMHPTMEIGLIARRDVDNPRRLAIMKATSGYLDLADWEEVIHVPSKPVVAEKLLKGEADAGIASVMHVDENPDALRVVESFGEVMTSWNVFGSRQYRHDSITGRRIPLSFFTGSAG